MSRRLPERHSENGGDGTFGGATVYGALIAAVARRLSVDKLLTLNADDFRRVWLDGKQVISAPCFFHQSLLRPSLFWSLSVDIYFLKGVPHSF